MRYGPHQAGEVGVEDLPLGVAAQGFEELGRGAVGADRDLRQARERLDLGVLQLLAEVRDDLEAHAAIEPVAHEDVPVLDDRRLTVAVDEDRVGRAVDDELRQRLEVLDRKLQA